MRALAWTLGALLVLLLGAWAYNASWFERPHGDGRIRLIAHRGVHQSYPVEGLTNQSCIAERIDPRDMTTRRMEQAGTRVNLANPWVRVDLLRGDDSKRSALTIVIRHGVLPSTR